MRRPAFWLVLALLSIGAVFVGVHYFPQAFSILALDITMDRGRALDEARRLAARDGLGPAGYREAASFSGDDEAQTFVELEGGGKDVFTRMLRENLYAAYTWRVRHFKDGETNETTIAFTPDGRAYGFTEKLKEDSPGAALDAAAARRLAEDGATGRWNVDLSKFGLVEQGQERRRSGRVDHTFTYERADAALNEGRYRLTLTVAGDRLTGVNHFIRIPEAFTRRYAKMRSANELIGIGSVVGLALLYVIGGIGVGLFFMMRRRWVLWRTAAMWGTVVGGLQTLAAVNEFPLQWMTYDTAIPRSTFLAQQVATLGAAFVGFSVFFGLSFMAAETLSRRAFGHHPQLWRVWSKEAGASIQILGRTVSGYLLVSIFFAYDVLLYLVMTKVFGWWSPAEALIHPDVLATYAPWLSAIANSFQAGFWEESLFRAVPIAGAALIGDRFGRRRLFIVIAFVVQAIVFGAGHAPYPNQPAYARPVELIIPSIGFGLLYLYFGLLPGIILHFAFDVTWFALPVFLAKAPGIWFQQFMIAALTLVPLWVVLWRRMQVGRWRELSPALLNAAWAPPAAQEERVEEEPVQHHELSGRARIGWMAAAAVALLAAAAAVALRGAANPYGPLPIERAQAETTARAALQQRGVSLPPKWRVMGAPDDGGNGPHQFVYETSGEARWRELLGVYLPKPRWRMRAATFTGDANETAEEWQLYVTPAGEVRNVRHIVPQARAGATLDEAAARQRAFAAVKERFALEAGQVREISAKPQKQKARTDWTFTFTDTTVAPLHDGEPRIDVDLAGDEVASAGRYVYVPEEWQRQQRAGSTRNFIIQIATSVVFGGLLLSAAIAGMVAWSRSLYTPRLFLAAAVLVFLVSAANILNNAPLVIAVLPTAAPLIVQLTGVIAASMIGLTLIGALVGLAIGALPHRLAPLGRLSDRDALRLGVAGGLFGAAAAAVAALVRTPIWAQFPSVNSLGAAVPLLQLALEPIGGFMTRLAVVTATLATIERLTASWTRRRIPAIAAIAAIGFLAGGAPSGTHFAGWAIAGAITAAAFVILYAGLLRFDLTLVPLCLGTMIAIGSIARGAQHAFPGALAGSIAGAIVVLAIAYWWFRRLRSS
ncbi:MAG TPA: hypothetical protein VL225_00810 [Vicinamibacterales bacterium]|nr:hypothetical protein [Vicinamibacterales bacterium]